MSRSEQDLANLYLSGAKAEPPAELDRRIKAEARRAVGFRSQRRWSWLATAATMVLAVGLAWRVFDHHREPLPEPASLIDDFESVQAEQPVDARLLAKPDQAETGLSLAAPAVAPSAAKTKAAPSAGAAAERERAAQAAWMRAEAKKEMAREAPAPRRQMASVDEASFGLAEPLALDDQATGEKAAAAPDATDSMQREDRAKPLAGRASGCADILPQSDQPDTWLALLESLRAAGRSADALCVQHAYELKFAPQVLD